MTTKARHIPLLKLQLWQAPFLCGDSRIFLGTVWRKKQLCDIKNIQWSTWVRSGYIEGWRISPHSCWPPSSCFIFHFNPIWSENQGKICPQGGEQSIQYDADTFARLHAGSVYCVSYSDKLGWHISFSTLFPIYVCLFQHSYDELGLVGLGLSVCLSRQGPVGLVLSALVTRQAPTYCIVYSMNIAVLLDGPWSEYNPWMAPDLDKIPELPLIWQ